MAIIKVEKSKVVLNTGVTVYVGSFLTLHNILVLVEIDWMRPLGQRIHSTKWEYDE